MAWGVTRTRWELASEDDVLLAQTQTLSCSLIEASCQPFSVHHKVLDAVQQKMEWRLALRLMCRMDEEALKLKG